MTQKLIVEPLPIVAVSNRGSGAANLGTFDPKEVWADTAVGTAATITVDLGTPRLVDTVFLGYVRPPAAAALWTVTGGLNAATEMVLQASTALRVPDAADQFAPTSHALWHGGQAYVRYIAVSLSQPSGSAPLTAGVLVIGRALAAPHEWGAGRRLIDTGSATPLPSGGFSVVEGARKRALTWTFGDLTAEQVDRLEAIALSRGDTATALVVEDAARTAGLWSRIHYGLFKWRAFERRNKVQTRWEMEIVEWI